MVSTRQSSGQGDAGASTSFDTSGLIRSSRPSQDSAAESSPTNQQIFLLDLPQEVVEKILNYLKFKNISQLRTVCHQFDSICSNVLNTQFHKLQNQMLTRFQSIKARMPRRESARRNHPLACESDIIETLHMRLTLLHMTFGKHIERNHCCFFPGEILDEVHKILVYIASTPKLARPYKVTDELFDLSTMAMEYFKEKIEPTLPEISYFGTEFLEFTGTFPPCTTKYMTLDSPKAGDESPIHCSAPPLMASAPVTATVAANRVALAMRRRINRMRITIRRLNNQLGLTRREELNKCKTEFQYWRSKSPATPLVCGTCGCVMQQQPSSEELRGLLGADFVPIAGPSRQCGECEPAPEAPEELQVEEANPEEAEATAEAAKAKRKRSGASRDPLEGRKLTRGGAKGRKKLKL
ncbi:hypothetical protein B566_EDAN005284 [Ephemera danica]|nr:hypothetical protein B566_EDAN005284 [Ephemera danica]